MNSPRISIIAAIGATNRVLGKDNTLLWHIPEDMKRFKALTKDHVVIMGRKTMDSIFEYLGGPLPRRMNIVVTRNEDYSLPGVVRASSLEDALEKAQKLESGSEAKEKEVFIIGGAQIYTEGLAHADRLYLTLVKTDVEGDAYFPAYDAFTKKVSEEIGADGTYEYTFVTLEK